MTYIYHNNGKVKMISEKKQDTDLSHVKKKLSKTEQENFENSFNFHIKVKNNKLSFEEKKFVKKAKLKSEILKEISDGKNFKNTKDIIVKLLDLIE